MFTLSNVRRTGRQSSPPAFTLIELLVVIGIISILAALLFPIGNGVKRFRIRARARAELAQVQSAIEGYKAKLGSYPPDNSGKPENNALYYELRGVKATVGGYVDADGSSVPANALTTLGISGFVNCTRGGGDEDTTAVPFLNNLRPVQYQAVSELNNAVVLGTAIDGPTMYSGTAIKINPWRYQCTGQQHNQATFDLWVDVFVGKETERICNWSPTPIKP
jgi:prepilin-type N-terminal cleavage/methylation domain-containing protein